MDKERERERERKRWTDRHTAAIQKATTLREQRLSSKMTEQGG